MGVIQFTPKVRRNPSACINIYLITLNNILWASHQGHRTGDTLQLGKTFLGKSEKIRKNQKESERIRKNQTKSDKIRKFPDIYLITLNNIL